VKLEFGLALDDDGQIATVLTVGFIQPGVSLGAGGSVALWGVDTVQDLQGEGVAIGGNVAAWGAEWEMTREERAIGLAVGKGGGWPVGL
jgi:hypothetical protein